MRLQQFFAWVFVILIVVGLWSVHPGIGLAAVGIIGWTVIVAAEARR